MHIFLWVLQILLALHTAMGAVWKVSNAEQAVPSLSAIPHGAWLSLSIIELLCSVALILPVVSASIGNAALIAATCIAAEMLLFTAVHLRSGSAEHGQMVYWLIVAAFSAFIVYGRFALQPFG